MTREGENEACFRLRKDLSRSREESKGYKWCVEGGLVGSNRLNGPLP